ncbi:RNA polymerase sigma factor SigW [Siminovitchia sp. FSL H7-0308]|uniref:RNA polymerase sigma factor n=1 Tax=Siminovitchia thermophila TaxID=1245522 RepID=A0ABS2R967_9BACI|nr:RNA polymerase sigma factor SigW [Siminovitchia thermophila]MBM7716201.1 RNA polymerase sigma-70 factor (ECF subfamily) [Siminovitchia thermophila]ONK21455.1 RNA polymerase sigma factor SigW [Bacillus sp. VT-16-64]
MDKLVNQRIKQVIKGDQEAFGEIVEIYKDKIFSLCFRMLGNRHEAEDIAQEAFIRAYTNIESFQQNRKFSTWLYRIATNLCIDRIRKKKPDYFLDAEIAGTEGLTLYSQLPSSGKTPDAAVETLEIQEIVQREIMRLPDKYRSVIVLRYIDDLSLNEIAEVLELPLGTVKTRIHRGREALRKQLHNM